MNIERKGVRRL